MIQSEYLIRKRCSGQHCQDDFRIYPFTACCWTRIICGCTSYFSFIFTRWNASSDWSQGHYEQYNDSLHIYDHFITSLYILHNTALLQSNVNEQIYRVPVNPIGLSWSSTSAKTQKFSNLLKKVGSESRNCCKFIVLKSIILLLLWQLQVHSVELLTTLVH